MDTPPDIPDAMPPRIPLPFDPAVGDVVVLNSGCELLMTFIGHEEDNPNNGVFVFEREGDLESWVLPMECVLKYPLGT